MRPERTPRPRAGLRTAPHHLRERRGAWRRLPGTRPLHGPLNQWSPVLRLEAPQSHESVLLRAGARPRRRPMAWVKRGCRACSSRRHADRVGEPEGATASTPPTADTLVARATRRSANVVSLSRESDRRRAGVNESRLRGRPCDAARGAAKVDRRAGVASNAAGDRHRHRPASSSGTLPSERHGTPDIATLLGAVGTIEAAGGKPDAIFIHPTDVIHPPHRRDHASGGRGERRLRDQRPDRARCRSHRRRTALPPRRPSPPVRRSSPKPRKSSLACAKTPAWTSRPMPASRRTQRWRVSSLAWIRGWGDMYGAWKMT